MKKAHGGAGLALAGATAAAYALLSAATAGAAWQDIFVDQVVTVQKGRYLSLLPLPFGPLGVPVLAATIDQQYESTDQKPVDGGGWQSTVQFLPWEGTTVRFTPRR